MLDLPFTLPALHAAYADGLSPEAVVEEAYRRIEATGDDKIFLHLRPKEDVLAEAKALGPFDPAKPLWGAPYAAKDNIDAAGIPTTAACPAYAFTPEADATVVAKLKADGALLLGKTNLDQFATGLVGVRTPYGAPKNAVDPEIVPGGSSGGSGVVVGHGAVCFSLGTDTAGSGRVPAALNNIVGLKPSLGTLSATGLAPACRTLDTISIFALTVADAWTAFLSASGYDPADAYSRPLALAAPGPLPKAMRIGIPDASSIEFFGDEAQAQMFDAAIAVLKEAGAEIVPIDFTPLYDVAHMLYEGAWVAERYTVIEDLLKKDPEAVHPVTSQIIRAAEKLSAADAFRGIYRLKELSRAAEPSLDGLTALCVPTIPTFYSVKDLEADPVTPNSNFGTYTNFVNLMDMCGIAVPTAARSDGRPGSVTLLAEAGQDGLCAAIAQVFESAAPGRRLGATDAPVPAPAPLAAPRPDPAAPGAAPAAGEILVTVCGAHMSGLPLNHELTSRGGRLAKRTRTAPLYRFYALAGGPPFRPGLVRGEAGAAIEVEVWALPMAAFGSFMAGIPSPLCIGTVQLEDGTATPGFLVEPAGIDGAQEITDLGSWRAFVSAPA